MTLSNPFFLLLIIPFLIAFIISLLKRTPSLVVYSSKSFNKGKTKFNRTKVPLIFYFLSCISLIIALSRPQKGLEIIEDERFVLDIILALDISGSMEAFDAEEGIDRNRAVKDINSNKLKPRIEVAKEELLKFVDKRPDDRLGLIVFAQTSFSSCPPTLEHDYLKEKIKGISTKMLGDFSSATGIAAPIKSAVNKLKNSPAKRRVVILFTDGENTVTDDITPTQAANIANEHNISIYTIGIGSDNSYAIQTGFFGRRSLVSQKAGFNEKLLKDIADTTQAKYFQVKSQREFKKVIQEINSLEKVEVKNKNFTHYKEFYHYFLLFSLLSLFMGSLLQSTILRSLP